MKSSVAFIPHLLISLLLLPGGCGGGESTTDAVVVSPDLPPSAVVDIRADVNRNGVVDLTDPTEDADEERWDDAHGAIFLANLDDDDLNCPRPTSSMSDAVLAACHDASNETLDGATDLEDLAPLKTVAWSEAPQGASGSIKLSLPVSATTDARTYVRLFRLDQGALKLFGAADRLSTDDLRKGIELRIEGRDIVRDPRSSMASTPRWCGAPRRGGWRGWEMTAPWPRC